MMYRRTVSERFRVSESFSPIGAITKQRLSALSAVDTDLTPPFPKNLPRTRVALSVTHTKQKRAGGRRAFGLGRTVVVRLPSLDQPAPRLAD
jgi:hypothetical protein